MARGILPGSRGSIKKEDSMQFFHKKKDGRHDGIAKESISGLQLCLLLHQMTADALAGANDRNYPGSLGIYFQYMGRMHCTGVQFAGNFHRPVEEAKPNQDMVFFLDGDYFASEEAVYADADLCGVPLSSIKDGILVRQKRLS